MVKIRTVHNKISKYPFILHTTRKLNTKKNIKNKNNNDIE